MREAALACIVFIFAIIGAIVKNIPSPPATVEANSPASLEAIPADAPATKPTDSIIELQPVALLSEQPAPTFEKHLFVPSVDTPTLCDTCGENIYNEIHIWKNVSAHVDDGPTPLTEAEFADLQRWLKNGKSLKDWTPAYPHPFNAPNGGDICTCGRPKSDPSHAKYPPTAEPKPQATFMQCGPGGCYVPQQRNYTQPAYQRSGFRPLRRLFGR